MPDSSSPKASACPAHHDTADQKKEEEEKVPKFGCGSSSSFSFFPLFCIVILEKIPCDVGEHGEKEEVCFALSLPTVTPLIILDTSLPSTGFGHFFAGKLTVFSDGEWRF